MPRSPDQPPHREVVDVRFREVDVYGVVWHGHFLDWLESARHRFASHFGFDTMAALERGHRLPLVELHVEYRQPARFGDRVAVDIALEDDPRKVIAFRYQVRRAADGELLATARTVQVVQGADGELLVGWPDELDRLLAAMRSYAGGDSPASSRSTIGNETQKRAP
jgi:acyl-CoA thioester hydrolase